MKISLRDLRFVSLAKRKLRRKMGTGLDKSYNPVKIEILDSGDVLVTLCTQRGNRTVQSFVDPPLRVALTEAEMQREQRRLNKFAFLHNNPCNPRDYL